MNVVENINNIHFLMLQSLLWETLWIRFMLQYIFYLTNKNCDKVEKFKKFKTILVKSFKKETAFRPSLKVIIKSTMSEKGTNNSMSELYEYEFPYKFAKISENEQNRGYNLQFAQIVKTWKRFVSKNLEVVSRYRSASKIIKTNKRKITMK